MTKVVSMKDYNEIYYGFLQSTNLINIETSEMIDNEYHKTFLCEDGQNMWESNSIVKKDVDVVVGCTEMRIEISVIKHELWNTKDCNTYIAYEKI